jgi:hypothetical protein
MGTNAHNEAWQNCHQNLRFGSEFEAKESQESHVAVTTIIITTLFFIVIRDYGRWNKLIGGMMPDKLFHEI